jgi:hypothetical protein
MKFKWCVGLAAASLLAGCTKAAKTPTSPEPVTPPAEQLVGKLYFHDYVGGQLDILMADLYLVPKASFVAKDFVLVRFPRPEREGPQLRHGIERLKEAEVGGRIVDRPVVKTIREFLAIDLSQYDFALKNLENLTEPTSDDFAVAVNSRDWIAYVKDPDGVDNNPLNSEIVYMNLADRVRHQLTPINGQYAGDNCDPRWKDDETITWAHHAQFVEVNINDLNTINAVLPDWNWPQYDPVYSPDGTRLLFNTWVRGKKNSFLKYLQTGTYESVLPQDYFAPYTDDNPTWVFSNTRITGHIFMPRKGRIYARDLDSGAFFLLTDGQRDFRYVTPVRWNGLTCLVFTEFIQGTPTKLWICDETGADLRELNQTGNEAVFVILGLAAPQSEQDLGRLALEYSLRFRQ